MSRSGGLKSCAEGRRIQEGEWCENTYAKNDRKMRWKGVAKYTESCFLLLTRGVLRQTRRTKREYIEVSDFTNGAVGGIE